MVIRMQVPGQSGNPDIFRTPDRVPDNQFNGTSRRDQNTPAPQFFNQRDRQRLGPRVFSGRWCQPMNKFTHEGSCEGPIAEPGHDLRDMFASRLRASIIDRQIGSAGINLICKKGQHHVVGLFSNLTNPPGMAHVSQ